MPGEEEKNGAAKWETKYIKYKNSYLNKRSLESKLIQVMFILHIATDFFQRFVWNIYQHEFSSHTLWILRFFTFVCFLHWVIKLVFQSITTAFTGLGYLSVCHHLRNTAHENIFLKLPKWELGMAQLVLFFMTNERHDLFLCEVLSTCTKTKLLVSCRRNWVYNWKKEVMGFIFILMYQLR